MSMGNSFKFHLESGKPIFAREFEPSDETLGEMVETIFPLDTDSVILQWGEEKFELNYKYDISMMLDDLLTLIREIRSSPSGKKVIAWVSSGFPFQWEVSWIQNSLEIHMTPHEITNATIDPRGNIRDSISNFISEWVPVLGIVNSAAIHSGYDISKYPNGKFLLSLVK